jgi:hypothetical protein
VGRIKEREQGTPCIYECTFACMKGEREGQWEETRCHRDSQAQGLLYHMWDIHSLALLHHAGVPYPRYYPFLDIV